MSILTAGQAKTKLFVICRAESVAVLQLTAYETEGRAKTHAAVQARWLDSGASIVWTRNKEWRIVAGVKRAGSSGGNALVQLRGADEKAATTDKTEAWLAKPEHVKLVVHGFLGGLFGFVGLLGIRAYLAFGPAFGRFGALLCGAVVTHGCSVVNAGIAAGDGSGVRHASNYLGLVARYVSLVVANAWRTRGPLRIISLLCVVGAAWTASSAARTKHGDDCPLAK